MSYDCVKVGAWEFDFHNMTMCCWYTRATRRVWRLTECNDKLCYLEGGYMPVPIEKIAEPRELEAIEKAWVDFAFERDILLKDPGPASR